MNSIIGEKERGTTARPLWAGERRGVADASWRDEPMKGAIELCQLRERAWASGLCTRGSAGGSQDRDGAFFADDALLNPNYSSIFCFSALQTFAANYGRRNKYWIRLIRVFQQSGVMRARPSAVRRPCSEESPSRLWYLSLPLF